MSEQGTAWTVTRRDLDMQASPRKVKLEEAYKMDGWRSRIGGLQIRLVADLGHENLGPAKDRNPEADLRACEDFVSGVHH